MFIDAHSHIHVNNFDADREQVIARAQSVGVSKIIEVGFDSEGIFKALALAKKHDQARAKRVLSNYRPVEQGILSIFATAGIHPHLASEWNDNIASKIRKLAKTEDRIVAIGETGLDYFKNFQPRDLQQKVFHEQLKIAIEVGLPVIIHCRDAYKDLFSILDEEKFSGRVLLHCFTGTMQEAEENQPRIFYSVYWSYHLSVRKICAKLRKNSSG